MEIVKNRLSVVIPCYHSEKNIEKVVADAEGIFEKNGIEDYEFILVNDCSPDRTLSILKKIARHNSNVTVVDLAKNSGQHAALMAGFHMVTGEYVVTCEDDGQTQMEAIGEMMEKLLEGYDVVAAKYRKRPQTSVFRRFGSYMAKKMSIAMMPRPKGISVPIFFLARRFVIDEMTKYEHSYPYVTGLLLRTTHNIANVEVEQLSRMSGSTGYTFGKLLHLWLNGFTAFSIKPLRMAAFLGMASSAVGIVYAFVIIFRRLFFHNMIAGWSSTISVLLIMSGIILCVLGMIGEYVGRIYMCINHTPQYVIRNVFPSQELHSAENEGASESKSDAIDLLEDNG